MTIGQPCSPAPKSRWGRRGVIRALIVLGLISVIGVSAWRAWTASSWAANQRLIHVERQLALWRLEAAAVELTSCRAQWPDIARVHFLSARVARLREQYDEASRHLREFVRLGGSIEDFQLENMLLAAYRGMLDDGDEAWQRLAQQTGPDRAFIYDALIVGFRKTMRIDKAEEYLKTWQASDPEAIPALLHQGWFMERAERLDEAHDVYVKILEVDEQNDDARLLLAGILVNLFRPAQAAEHFTLLSKRRPDDVLVQLGLARCRYLQGEYDQARVILDPLLEKHPADAGVVGQCAQLALQMNDWATAETLYRRASALKPFNYQFAFSLHRALRSQNKTAEASAQLERAEQIEVDYKRIHTLVTDEIPRAPRNPKLRHEAGLILQRHGDYHEAIRWLQSALREDPYHIATHRALAECYEKTGRQDLADEHRRQAN